MEESVTLLPALLDRATAKRHLAVLASMDPTAERDDRWWPDTVYDSDRKWVEGLLDIVNASRSSPEAAPLAPARYEALRALLEERVAIRERAALMGPKFVKDAARDGLLITALPHRTVALSMAAEALPVLLNDHVRKPLHFENVGAAVTRRGRLKRTSQPVTLTVEGSGGALAVTEHVVCDSTETSLNYALALALAKNQPFGAALCRCHAPGCGRFWLLPEKLKGKPSRNFCTMHETEKKRLSDAERKSRQRATERARKAAAAKHK